MKKETKQDIKEWFQLMGLVALSGIIVFHTNSLFTSEPKDAEAKLNDADKTVERVDSAAARDSVAAINKARNDREIFIDGIRRGMQTR